MQRYEGGNNPGNDASGEDNRTKAPKILHKSSKELYRAVAKQWGITCKMSDHCRCLDCQVSLARHQYRILSSLQRSETRNTLPLSFNAICIENPPLSNIYLVTLSFRNIFRFENLNLISAPPKSFNFNRFIHARIF